MLHSHFFTYCNDPFFPRISRAFYSLPLRAWGFSHEEEAVQSPGTSSGWAIEAFTPGLHFFPDSWKELSNQEAALQITCSNTDVSKNKKHPNQKTISPHNTQMLRAAGHHGSLQPRWGPVGSSEPFPMGSGLSPGPGSLSLTFSVASAKITFLPPDYIQSFLLQGSYPLFLLGGAIH